MGLAGSRCGGYNAAMTQHESLKPKARVDVSGVTFSNDAPIAILAGPCQMESRAHALEMASALKEAATKLGVAIDAITSLIRR